MGVVTSEEGRVSVIVLDWPERRNAIGPEQVAELADRIESVSAGGAEGLVVTGHGAFCAGGDLGAIMALVQEGAEAVRDAVYSRFQRLPMVLLAAPIPVFAAVDGPAIGLGMDLALACDDRFIGPKGWFRQGWGDLGLVPGTGGELLLRRLAPNLIWQLLASPERVDGVLAERYGLGHAAPASARVDAVAAMERLVSAVPGETLRAYTALHRGDVLGQLERHLSACLDYQVGLLTSDRFAAQANRILGIG